ncbi:MAG: lysine--tRNA ligase [Promethearchaeota archaeon]
MTKEFPIHWLEDIVKKIDNRNEEKITLATGKTPSGHIHLGILREIIICDAIRRIYEKRGRNVEFFLFMDSFDAAKRFPDYISNEFQEKHLGKPFFMIPCPYEDCKCESFAYHFGEELISSFSDFGIKNDIIWTHELYSQKEMQEKIKESLKNTDKIKKILKSYILPTLDEDKKEKFIEMQKNWMPVMVICENCNKIQHKETDGSILPNRVRGFDEKENTVNYICPACGYKNEISIYSGRLKLNWRVDWPAKWSLFNTTCEPAGKDHCVKGGAYDSGLEICQSVFGYEGPIKVPYEWLRLGEIDMKTSKGIVFTPQKYLELADPEIFRMLILRTDPMKHISLRIEELPQYYDYYEKMEEAFFEESSSELSNEEKKILNFLYPLTITHTIPKDKPERIPLNLMIFLSQIQNILDMKDLYAKAKEIMDKESFENLISFEEFKAQIKKTKKWINEVKKIINEVEDPKKKREISRKITIFEIPEKVNKNLVDNLDKKQIEGIRLIREFLKNNEELTEEDIQNKIFNVAKEQVEISPKKLFQALYQVILGKKYGPRLGSFIILLDKEWLLNRFNL